MMKWFRKDPDEPLDEYYAERSQRTAREFAPLWIHLCVMLIALVAALLIVWGAAGREMLFHFLRQLAAPVGLLWLGLGLMSYFSLVRRAPATAVASILLWLLLTLCGNWFVQQALIRSLEAAYPPPPLETLGHFDVVLVLGGGSNTLASGRVQLTAGGDRLLTAARLYHAGQIDRLVATGMPAPRGSAADLGRAAESRLLWSQIGIPEAAITSLGATGTGEELVEFAQWLNSSAEAQGDSRRIGLITSAWHMRRAIVLAKAHGIEVVPIPCDYLGRAFQPDPSMIVPSAENLAVVNRALNEYVGAWLVR